MKSFMVRGVEIRCCSDIMNIVLEKATWFKHDYEGLETARSLNDLKGWIPPPLLLDVTPRWIEAGVHIEKNDLNVVSQYWFRIIRSSIMPHRTIYPSTFKGSLLRINLSEETAQLETSY